MRAERVVPHAPEQDRTEDEQVTRQQLLAPVAGHDACERRAEIPLKHKAGGEPDAHELELVRQNGRERLDQKGQEGIGIGEPYGRADGICEGLNLPEGEAPWLVNEEEKSEPMLLPVAVEKPADVCGNQSRAATDVQEPDESQDSGTQPWPGRSHHSRPIAPLTSSVLRQCRR